MDKIKKILEKPSMKQVIASLLCILFGFLVGIVVMLVLVLIDDNLSFSNLIQGIGYLFAGPFSSSNINTVKSSLGNMIFYTVPLIFTGLSVAIAYKTGLFNIGAPGQFLMGTTGALLIALNIDCSNSRFLGVLVWILAILVGTLMGALWGAIPGIFKAIFERNEVVVCIMTNWIAANLTTWIFSTQESIINTPEGKSAYLIKPEALNTYTPILGLDKILPNSYIDIGIIIAILVAIAMFIIMNKTTFGYELKACGANKHASKYAGMNEKRNIILSMVIAGALAALGGCFYYLNKGIEFQYSSAYTKLPDYGFNGISSALLANCNPCGVIFSSMFLRYINASGSRLQMCGFNSYIAGIITAVIIYCAGFSRLFIELLSRRKVESKFKKYEPEPIKDDKKEDKE